MELQLLPDGMPGLRFDREDVIGWSANQSHPELGGDSDHITIKLKPGTLRWVEPN